MPDIHAKLRRLRDLRNLVSAARAALTERQTELDELEQDCATGMAEAGLSRATIDDVTYYVSQRLFVSKRSGVEMDALVRSLITAGLGDFVGQTANTNRLRSYFRELEDDARQTKPDANVEDLVPAELVALLNVARVPCVGVLGGKKKENSNED